MAIITEGDKVRIHCPSKKLYDNKIGKVHHIKERLEIINKQIEEL